MCRKGIIYLFSHSSGGVTEQQIANMLHAAVDGRSLDPASNSNEVVYGQVRSTDGSVLLHTCYRSKWRHNQLQNEFLVFFTNIHAEKETVLMGTTVMPWVDLSNSELMELWYSGRYGKQTKAMPYSSSTLHGDGAKALRQLLGLENQNNGAPREKQTVSGATMVIAHHKIKFKHPSPSSTGAVNTIWPLSGTTVKYHDFANPEYTYSTVLRGSMHVLKVPEGGLKAMSNLAKLEVPLVPNSSGTTKICGRTMFPYTSAVKTWRAALFPPDETEDDGFEVLLAGAPPQFSAEQKIPIRALGTWAKGEACKYARAYESALANEGLQLDGNGVQEDGRAGKPLEEYRAIPIVTYQQGRLSTDVGLLTPAHRSYSGSFLEALRDSHGIHLVNIDIPLGEYGCFQRFFVDFHDMKGRTIHTSFGSALIYPAMLAEEVGWITHIKGNPRLSLRIFVSSSYNSDKALAAMIRKLNGHTHLECREYVHLPWTSQRYKKKAHKGEVNEDWEEELAIVHKRMYKEKTATFQNNPQVEPIWFDRFKLSHDYKTLYATFA